MSLKGIRRRLIRIESDVRGVEVDLARFGEKEAEKKEEVLARLKDLEEALRKAREGE